MTNTATIQLIGWGRIPAKPAGEIKVGDVITYNYGYQYTVTSVSPSGEKSVRVGMVGNKHGISTSQRFLKSRLVAAETPKAPEVKMVQGTLREVPTPATDAVVAYPDAERFVAVATAQFKAMLGSKVRAAIAAGATEEQAIAAVRALWLDALR